MLDIIALADGVKTAINTQFSGELTATREYKLRVKLTSLSTMRVVVSPSRETASRVARTKFEEEGTIDICVQKRCADNDEADDVLDLTKRIKQYFMTTPRAVSGYVAMVFERIPYAQEHWDESGVITSLVTITFRAYS